MKVAIVGAGASGLVCAISLARNAKSNNLLVEVTLVESKEKAGKKILATGNGRCNMMNTNEGDFYFCANGFVDYTLKKFNVKSNLDFFASLGLLTRVDEEGRVYPLSNQATGVLDALRFACEGYGVKIITDYTVEAISYKNKKFIINSDQSYDAVVLACGGKAAVKNFNGYELLKQLGHKVTGIRPSLTKLEVSDRKTVRHLKGTKQKGKFTLMENGLPVAIEKGELLFTDYGLSGIAIMQLSAFAVRCKGRLTLQADFVPEITHRELFDVISRYSKSNRTLKNENLLTGFVPKRLCEIIVKDCKLELSENAYKLTDGEIRNIVSKLKKYVFEISDFKGFEDAQVTAGGADTEYFNKKTLESVKIKGLYCIGELLDVDGLCGGYNLQWAWSSGRLCAESIINSQLNRKG